MTGYTRIPGINFTGGSAGSGSSLDTLTDAELAGLNGSDVSTPNSILDTYNSEIATLGANAEVISSLVRLKSGQNADGTVEHKLNLSVNMASVEGGMVVSMHSAAVQSVSGNDMIIKGDATALFPDSSRVLISTKTEQLGRTTHTGLADNDNNIARLTVASTSFDGTNTTVTMNNLTPALSLDMGVATIDMPEQLRISPFDWDLEASATGDTNYENLEIVDIHGIDTIRIEGSNFYKVIDETLSGSVNKLDGNMSQNGQYGIIRVMENTAGFDTFHWYGSKDRGETWSKVVGTKSSGVNQVDEFSNGFQFLNSPQVKVANNGKFTSLYVGTTSGNNDVRGVYGDLSLVTPTVLDFPDTPDNNIASIGVVYSAGSTASTSTLDIDPVDASYVAIIVSNVSNNNANIFTYSDAGATYIEDTGFLGASTIDADVPYMLHVTGTGSSHRILFARRNASSGVYHLQFRDEGNLGVVGDFTNEYSTNAILLDSYINDTYWFFLLSDGGNSKPYLQWVEYGASTVLSNPIQLSELAKDNDVGVDSAVDINLFKQIGSQIRTNPADDKHVFIIKDMVQPGGQARMSTLFEIKDITTVVGDLAFSRPAGGITTSIQLRVNTNNNHKAAQTLPTVPANTRSIAVKLWRIGTIASGNFYFRLKTGTTTGAGTLVQEFTRDTAWMNKITPNFSNNDQVVYFNLDTPLAAGDYHIEYDADYPVNAPGDGQLVIPYANLVNNYAGQFRRATDGDVWSDLNHDTWFELKDHWVDTIGFGQGLIDGLYNIYDCESSMDYIDSNSLKLLFRRTYAGLGASRRTMGHPFERTLTVSNTSNRSSMTDIVCSAYDENGDIPNYDRNLVASSSFGNDICAPLDIVTGTINGGRNEDRSQGIQVGSITGEAQTTDSDFESGFCYDLSTGHVAYTHSGLQNIKENEPFVVEIETKRDVDGVFHTIMSKGPSGGWQWYVNSTNQLVWSYTGATTTVSNETFTGTDLRKYKITGDGDKFQMFTSEGAALTAGPNGSSVYTEVTYAQQQTGGYVACTSTQSLYIGRPSDSNIEHWNGRIGYFKFAIGSDEFAYEGFKSHPPVLAIKSLGANLMLGKQNIGQNDHPISVHYNRAGVAKDGEPLVDSYDMFVKVKKTFENAGKEAAVKTTMKRGSDTIQTSEQGRMLTFIKE